jgi:hypothetical protein
MGKIPGQEGRRPEIDGKVPVPPRLRQSLDLVGLEFGSIVDQKSQRTQRPYGLRHKAFDGIGFGQIGLHDSRFAACLPDPVDHALSLFCGAAAVDRYRVALGGESFDDSTPDTLGPTRHEGCFFHVRPLEM